MSKIPQTRNEAIEHKQYVKFSGWIQPNMYK